MKNEKDCFCVSLYVCLGVSARDLHCHNGNSIKNSLKIQNSGKKNNLLNVPICFIYISLSYLTGEACKLCFRTFFFLNCFLVWNYLQSSKCAVCMSAELCIHCFLFNIWDAQFILESHGISISTRSGHGTNEFVTCQKFWSADWGSRTVEAERFSNDSSECLKMPFPDDTDSW